MNCTSNINPIMDYESINSKILNNIQDVPEKVRKVVRLMAKQYEILEVYKEDDIVCCERMIRPEPYIIKYRNFGDDSVKFEWRLDIL